ncbi:protein JINGUBANG-like [Histomonas meleagridis]|uniref:protein JINGUBANG-like n=1 Tax=Histomonas meleagridis TaxID=135588 RepID=UPI0035598A2B|nr:protein JINGUBANG-like [Histomonas meleagridis]KAH0799383.1 protein JINGUBANG-like [Histomonas meleagridis]
MIQLQNNRHQPTTEENEIISKYYPLYHANPSYSSGRMCIVDQCLEELQKIDSEYWTKKRVQGRFNNETHKDKDKNRKIAKLSNILKFSNSFQPGFVASNLPMVTIGKSNNLLQTLTYKNNSHQGYPVMPGILYHKIFPQQMIEGINNRESPIPLPQVNYQRSSSPPPPPPQHQYQPMSVPLRNLPIKKRNPQVNEIPIYDNFEVGTFDPDGSLICSYLNLSDSRYVISYKYKEYPTGFFNKVTSIKYDSLAKRIYLQGDVRIRAFACVGMGQLECVDTCFISPLVVEESFLCFNDKFIIVSISSNVFLFEKNFIDSVDKGILKDKNYINYIMTLDKEQIDFTKGRPAKRRIVLQEEISCMDVVNDRLIVGTNQGEINVYNLNGKCTSKVYGHTERISNIFPFLDNFFFSGSEDGKVRMWERVHEPGKDFEVKKLLETGNCITSILQTNDYRRLLFVGCNDGKVRIWDDSKKINEIQIDDNCYAIEMNFNSQENKLNMIVVPEKTDENDAQEAKFISIAI